MEGKNRRSLYIHNGTKVIIRIFMNFSRVTCVVMMYLQITFSGVVLTGKCDAKYEGIIVRKALHNTTCESSP